MKDSPNSSFETLCGTELLPVGEAPTDNSIHISTPFPEQQSISDVTGTSWPPYVFVSDPIPVNLLFADPVPIDPLFSHVYFQYKPYYPLLRYPLLNARSEYLFDLVGQGCNRFGESSWCLGFDSRLFSFTWRNSGVPCVSRYRFSGDIDQKKESVMAHLFTLMKCSEAQVSKIYDTAMNAGHSEASIEFLESSKEFFTTANTNNTPQYQVTYVKDRWLPLTTFMRDPVVHRFLNHLTVNSYLERSARKDVVKLLKEVDLKYRDKLGSALVNLQVLFHRDVPSTATTSEKALSETGHQDIVPIVEGELENDPSPLLDVKGSSKSKSKKRKKKNSSKRKLHPIDDVPTQAHRSASNISNHEGAVTEYAGKELGGSLSGPPPTSTSSSPGQATAHDAFAISNPPIVVQTDLSSTQDSTAAIPNADVVGLSTYHTDTDTSLLEASAVEIDDVADLKTSAEALPSMADIKKAPATDETRRLPLVLSEQISTVSSPSLKSTQLAKVAKNSKNHMTSASKRSKAKRRGPSNATDSVTKEASSSTLVHSTKEARQNASIAKLGSYAADSSVGAKEASPSAIISGTNSQSNQDHQQWSDEMNVEEALRQFPNLKADAEERDNNNKIGLEGVQTGSRDPDDGWTVVKSIPKKVKRAVIEGSPKQRARKTSPKGLCIGTNYRISQKSGDLDKPAPVLSTADSLHISTKIEANKIQTPQPGTSKPKISVKTPTPTEVLPVSRSSSSEKRRTKVTNRTPSLKFPIDQVTAKSSVEVKLSANLKNDTLTSSTVTLRENHLSPKVNSEVPVKRTSNSVEVSTSDTESPQNIQVTPDIVPVLDQLPEDPPFGAITSQPTTERVPGILVGVLMKAGVEASALSSLMIETSSGRSHDNILAKSDNDLNQSISGLESPVMSPIAAEVEADCDDHIRSISPDDNPKNPTTPTLARDTRLSIEQNLACSENRASKENHDDRKLRIEDNLSNEDICEEQPVIDCDEYQGWVAKPTFITWDNRNGYEVLGDRCPCPLTLADHPDLNKVFKPGFVFKCAYCQQEIPGDMHKETAIVCPGCGPCSDVRYCQKSHLLADTLEHQKVCGTKSGEFPVLIHMLPKHYKSLYPYIKPISGSITPECFRQMAYTMIVKQDREIENPFLAFYNFKMSKKGKKRLADYKNDVYQFQDSGNYYIFNSADAPKGTATLVTLDMTEGGPFFNRARNALFLSNDPNLARFVYRKIKADVMLHPDKGFRAEALLALDSQFCCEFPHFDFSKVGYIGIGRLAYDVDAEWKAVEKIVHEYENTHPILKTWINPPKDFDKCAMQDWGVGWTGQPAKEWMPFLNIKYHHQLNYFFAHGKTKEQHDQEVKECRAELAGMYERRRVREAEAELEKKKAIEQEAEAHAEIDDQMHEDRMKLVTRHLANPAVQKIYRVEDEVKEEREAVARAQYPQ